MINPGEDEFRQDPAVGSTSFNEGENLKQTEAARSGAAQGVSRNAGEGWEDPTENPSLARRRTDYFLRENPIPTIIGALFLGLAVGWALRYATARDEREIETRAGGVNWSFLSLPFLWPFFKSVKEKYEDSADAVKDRVDRFKKIDVERYTKPIRKRWKAWTA